MIYPIRSIVAGVAELGAPDPVLAQAVRIAERTGAALHLVHAFDMPDVVWDAYARVGALDGTELATATRAVETRLQERVRELTPRRDVSCHAITGPAAPSIREVALREQADLILVGATRRGAIARAVLGTTAQRVVRSAPAPVLVLRDPLPDHLQRVLLTTDLSPFSAGVQEAGLDLLETLFEGDHPDLRSLLVVWYGMVPPPPMRPGLIDGVPHEELRTFLGERRGRGRTIEGIVRHGDPAQEIVAETAAWRPDLLVLGTHGWPVGKRWLLGSVAEAAMRSVGGNVLVIPALVEEQRTLPVPVHAADDPRAVARAC